MGRRHGANQQFIECVEPRFLLTVFAPDASYQPPAGAVSETAQTYPIGAGRYLLASSEQTLGANGDGGDNLLVFTKIKANGTRDKSFGDHGHLTFDPDFSDPEVIGSRIVVFSVGEADATLSAFTINGKPDESFGTDKGISAVPIVPLTALHSFLGPGHIAHVFDDNSMLLSLTKDTPNHPLGQEYELIKFQSNGTLDKSFGTNGVIAHTLNVGSLQEVLVAQHGIYADFSRSGEDPPSDLLIRFTLNGQTDTTFGDKGEVNVPIAAQQFTELPNGKLVFLVDDFVANPNDNPVLGRLNLDGSPDTTFGTNGIASATIPAGIDFFPDASSPSMAVDSQGRILISTGGTIFRFTTAGKVDSYPFDGTAQFDGEGITLDDQGGIVTTQGFVPNETQVRYAVEPYTQFGPDGVVHIYGTIDKDTVSVGRISHDRYQFIVNGETTDLSAPKVKQIDMDLYNGGSNVDVDSAVDAPVNIQTGDGADSIVTGNGADTISTGSGKATVNCGDGDDSVTIDAGRVIGGSGNKSVEITDGTSTVQLGVGNNHITADNNATLTLTIAGGNNTVQLDNQTSNVTIGGNGNNDIAADSYLSNDSITTGDGNDSINIEDFTNATIHAGGGNDSITTDHEPATIYGEGGNDIIQTKAGDDYISGGSGNDSINAGDGNNTVIGGAGDDVLISGTGNDYLSGQAGNDTLTGGGGKDTLLNGAS